MNSTDPAAPRFTPVLSHEQDEAAGILWSELSPSERDRHRQALLQPHPNSPPELWGAYRGHQLVAAMRAHLQAGRTAVISAPRARQGESPELPSALLGHVLDVLRQQGTRTVQALLAEDMHSDAEQLKIGGLAKIAELQYLVCLSRTFPSEPPAGYMEFHPRTDGSDRRLENIVERTYQGSLDCPAAEGLRNIDDVLLGYRHTDTYSPQQWLVASHAGQDIGCLIMADNATHNQSELMYIGVVPEARGHGYGLSLVKHAQWLARLADRGRLVLAVDAGNAPALAIYMAAGFVCWDQRDVYFRSL